MRELKRLTYEANRRLTPAFRLGDEAVDFSEFESPAGFGRAVDLEPARAVIDECMGRFTPEDSTKADAWLGPRLHHALRLTRREAGDKEIWRWLGCVFAPDYVRWRWGSADPSPPDPEKAAAVADRFVGGRRKQALWRLWLVAETFRNGGDYEPAAKALLNQDLVNNLFGNTVGNHRPTALAAVEVVENKTGREANALAKAINAAASTILIDALAPDGEIDPDAASRWISVDDVDVVPHFDTLPPGPDDPPAPADSVKAMTDLLGLLLAQARVRGRDY